MLIVKKALLVLVLMALQIGAVAELASGEGVVGYDLLALQLPNFPLEKYLSQIPNNSALGVLLDTFGDDRSKIENALASGKFVSFRIHLANGPGLRNKQLGAYENLSGLTVKSFEKKIESEDRELLKTFIDKAKYVNQLSLKFPNIKCFLSPVLEHNLSPASFSKLSEIVRREAPSCQIVNNPVNGWSFQLNSDQILELHGLQTTSSGQYIASQDGSFGPEDEFLNFHDKAFLRFIWKSSYNCRNPDNFSDPRSRQNCE